MFPFCLSSLPFSTVRRSLFLSPGRPPSQKSTFFTINVSIETHFFLFRRRYTKNYSREVPWSCWSETAYFTYRAQHDVLPLFCARFKCSMLPLWRSCITALSLFKKPRIHLRISLFSSFIWLLHETLLFYLSHTDRLSGLYLLKYVYLSIDVKLVISFRGKEPDYKRTIYDERVYTTDEYKNPLLFYYASHSFTGFHFDSSKLLTALEWRCCFLDLCIL